MKRELSNDEKAISFETHEHIYQVQKALLKAAFLIQQRCLSHDRSKMDDPEVELFTKMTPKLKTVVYGSEEYKQFLIELKPALDNHYANNTHHPEHYENGIEGMNLIDVIEMLCDWIAATKRTKDGDIQKSLEINAKRFNMSPQIVKIMKNTVSMLASK